MKNLSRERPLILVFTAGSALLFIFSPFPLEAAPQTDVVINEIAWMGTVNSPADEWMELYNNTAETISLTDWEIRAADGSPAIELTGEIMPYGFFILERTADDTLPQTPADQIYTGALNNDGERIELLGPGGHLIDEVDCTGGWFYGNNETKETMERTALKEKEYGQAWQNSLLEGGTPGRENSQGTAQEIVQTAGTIPFSDDIVFTELLPSPSGRDEDEEWVELLNRGDRRVSLAGWEIADQVGRTKTYVFGTEAAMEAGEFVVFSRQETGVTLNNEGDGLSLMDPGGRKIDQVSYGKAPTGESYILIDGVWKWSAAPTPGKENTIPRPGGETQGAVVLSSGEREARSSALERRPETEQASSFGSLSSGFASVFLEAFLASCFSVAATLTWKNFLKKHGRANYGGFDF
jgi:hypothetical protein